MQKPMGSRRSLVLAGAGAALLVVLLAAWWAIGTGAGDLAGDGRPAPAGAGLDQPPAALAGSETRDAVPPATGRGFFTAPVGSEFTYRFAARTTSRVELALAEQPAAQQMVVRLQGPMTVLVLARREAELQVQVRFAGVAAHQGVAGSETAQPELDRLLALPVLVRMGEDGSVLGFRFDDGTNGYVNNLVRSLLCGFRFVVPVDARASWESEEVDPTGIATVRYEWLGAGGQPDRSLRRTKTSYRAGPDQRSDLELKYEVQGVGLARLAPELGWLRSATVHETLTVAAEAARVRSSVESEASLELASHAWRNPASLPAVDWDRRWAGLEGADDTKAIAESSERELAELELGGATYASLLQDVLALAGATPHDGAALTDASHKLAILVRLHPEVLEQLGLALPTAPPFAADVLLGAIGAANTEPAQRLIAGLAGDAAAAPHLRQSALDSMIQLAEPNDAVLASVRNLVGDPQADSRLRDQGLLVLGALGSRQPRSETTGRDRVVADLIGFEERARSEGRLEPWLHALGNTGHRDVEPALERYLGHEQVALRHAALSALRQANTPSATTALLERARVERDPRVRALAIESLARRPDRAALEYVADLLEREGRLELRRAAVTGASHQLPGSDAVRRLLQRVAQHDPSPEIRELAGKALAGR